MTYTHSSVALMSNSVILNVLGCKGNSKAGHFEYSRLFVAPQFHSACDYLLYFLSNHFSFAGCSKSTSQLVTPWIIIGVGFSLAVQCPTLGFHPMAYAKINVRKM